MCTSHISTTGSSRPLESLVGIQRAVKKLAGQRLLAWVVSLWDRQSVQSVQDAEDPTSRRAVQSGSQRVKKKSSISW